MTTITLTDGTTIRCNEKNGVIYARNSDVINLDNNHLRTFMRVSHAISNAVEHEYIRRYKNKENEKL